MSRPVPGSGDAANIAQLPSFPATTVNCFDGAALAAFETSGGVIDCDLPAYGQNGAIPIERIVLDNVPLCETLTAP